MLDSRSNWPVLGWPSTSSIWPGGAQTIVAVMSDLDLGMNTWISPAFTWPTTARSRQVQTLEAKVHRLRASSGPLRGHGRRRHRLALACRARAGRSLLCREVGPQRTRRSTPDVRTTTKNLDALQKKFEDAKTSCKPMGTNAGGDDRHHRVRLRRHGGSGKRDQRLKKRTPRPPHRKPRVSVPPEVGRLVRQIYDSITSSSKSDRRPNSACCGLDLDRRSPVG